ncbi:MAG: hypothetical protein V7K67_02100 [Nostoc sp.]|uniref:hypothetical protein n=1 Tax=Nostoc sp. TaxID=1180 RepID=UPI002FF5E85F
MGHWALGIGHWALGMGYGALGMENRQGRDLDLFNNSPSSPSSPSSPPLPISLQSLSQT